MDAELKKWIDETRADIADIVEHLNLMAVLKNSALWDGAIPGSTFQTWLETCDIALEKLEEFNES